MNPYEELEEEAGGKMWAEAIVRAATKAIRDAKAQPGASAQVQVKIDVQRAAVVDVRRVVEERERARS